MFCSLLDAHLTRLARNSFHWGAFQTCSEQLSLEMLSVSLDSLVSLCLQGVAVAALLELSIALLVPRVARGPNFQEPSVNW